LDESTDLVEELVEGEGLGMPVMVVAIDKGANSYSRRARCAQN
jgi:hypothetical protein